MRRFRIMAGVVLALAVGGLVHAATLVYVANAQAVGDTGVSLTFTDNGSGGTGVAFPARSVFVKNDGVNEVFCDIRDLTATTSDQMIAAGEGFELGPSDSSVGIPGIGCITSAGESTTIRVRAQVR